jgi:hypothetical protein
MKSTIEAVGYFPAGIYAVGGDFSYANRLHECAAAISLIEELRQVGEACDIAKLAAVLFAGRVNVTRRILQPLIQSGLVIKDGNDALSVCDDSYVRQASLELTQLKFLPPVRAYKLILRAEEVPASSAPLASAFLAVEDLPKGLSSERFIRTGDREKLLSEAVACVSAKKKGAFIMRPDAAAELVACRHERSHELFLKYHFTQEQIDGHFQPGKLTITLEGDDLDESHWGWLVRPLNRLSRGREAWQASVSTPATRDIFNVLLRIKGFQLADVPGYVRPAPGFQHRLNQQGSNSDDDGFAIRIAGLEAMPRDAEVAVGIAINRLIDEAEGGKVSHEPFVVFAASFCRQFGFEMEITEDELSSRLRGASLNMSGAGRARLFAASDWRTAR